MIRRQDWPEKLSEYILSRAKMPFEWGSNDCGTFFADGVIQMTDEDPIADIRGKWTDAMSAARFIASEGGLEALLSARFHKIHGVLFAQRGDAGLVTLDDREFIAICTGSHWAAPGPEQMALLKLDRARVAFAVARLI